jgi:O-antigen/teichoic acid export membrane protein
MDSLLRSVTSILSGRVARIVLGVAFTPILVRLISQPQYGVYATVIAGFSVISLLAKGGLFDAIRKTVAEYERTATAQSDIVSAGLLVSVFYFAVVGGSVVFGVVYVDQFSFRESPYLLLLVVALFFGNLFAVVKASFYGLQREYVTELLQTGRKALFVVTALALAYAGFELTGVFAGYALSFIVVTVVGWFVLVSNFQLRLPAIATIRETATELSRYGGMQLIGGLSALLLYKTDIILVRYFRDSTAAALYNSAIVPAEYIWFVPAVMQMAFLQRTASLWASDQLDAINKQIRTGVKYALLSLSLFGVGLYTLAGPFLQLYFGPDYLPASSSLRVLLVGTFFFGISRVVNPVFQATGWLKYTEANTVLVLAVNILLNLLLIPRYGILGAAIATSCSYVLMFVGVTMIWWRSPFAFPECAFLGKIILVQVGFALVYLSIVSMLRVGPTLSLLVFPPLGAALFVGLNVVTGIVELHSLIGIIERLLGRSLR